MPKAIELLQPRALRVCGIPLDTIRTKIEKSFKLGDRELLAIDRHRDIVIPRHVFCHFCNSLGYGSSDIARFLGMHHSTVIHSISKAEELMRREPNLKFHYNKISRELKEEVA